MVDQRKSLFSSMNASITGSSSSGNGTIVLAHGFGGDQSMWDKVTPCLAKHYQVLAFDWHFSGAVSDPKLFDLDKYSSYDPFADDLIGLLDEQGLKSTILVGHSMSGMIGCIASIKRPELFDRLILLLASPRYLNLEDYVGGFEMSDVDGMISSMESNYEEWATKFAPTVVDSNDPSTAAKFRECLLSMRPEVTASLARTVFSSDCRDLLEKITTPCTIVHVTNDIAVPNSVAHYMKEKISGSTMEMIESTGHFPQLTAPDQLLDVLHCVLGLNTSNGSI